MVNDAIANPNKDKQAQTREHRNARNTFVLHVREHVATSVFIYLVCSISSLLANYART